MATTTSRLGLTKPDPADIYDINAMVNGNADVLDNATGALPATSGTRPSSPYNGQLIREADTGKLYVSNGSAPASGSWHQIPVDNAAYAGAGNFTLSGSGSNLSIGGSGSFTGALSVGSNLTVSGTASNLSVGGSGSFGGNITVGGTGSNLSVGGSGSIAGVLQLGTDVNIYRGAANVLATDDALNVGGTMGLLGATGALIALSNATTAPTGTPSGVVLYASGGGLFVRDGAGFLAVVGHPSVGAAPTGATAETIPRWAATTTAVPASGTLYLTGIWLQRGQTVTNVTFASGATGATTPTHWWFSIVDKNFKLQGHTADQTTTAWAATTAKTVALATPYTAVASGLYYCGFMMAATTLCTPIASAAATNQSVMSPPFSGASTTGLTTPGTDNSTTYATVTSNAAFTPFYAYVS